MFSDVAGYTALMGRDEREALRALEKHRDALLTLVPRFHGRILEEVGDGTLSIFQSAVDAAGCACELQKTLSAAPGLPVRIGVHVGDLLHSGGRVFGDAVNLASRIHGLAEPGGICISERVHDELRNKPEFQTALLGERELKNVDRPIRVYALSPHGFPTELPPGGPSQHSSAPK